MMDGYAVRAADSAGASPYNRLPLRLIGAAWPGRPCLAELAAGEAVQIMTGSPLPRGADAVLPAELCQAEVQVVWAHGEVSPGKHVGRRGEDFARDRVLLPAGRRLRPQDLGLLSAAGQAELPVVRRPRVAVLVTGSELLPAGSPPRDFLIADANGPMLRALVERDGGLLAAVEIVPDDRAAILQRLRQPADLTIVSGGSSVGQEDCLPELLSTHGELAIHGIAMRPSSPTGLGRIDGRLVVLLPGNPVSCLCAYDFFAGRAVRGLGGRGRDWPYRSGSATLVHKLSSVIGRVDYARVRRAGEAAAAEYPAIEPLAIGGAAILSSTTRADGFLIVPADCEGYPAGAAVHVWWYD
jgi:molybdopterin molybdotransferase